MTGTFIESNVRLNGVEGYFSVGGKKRNHSRQFLVQSEHKDHSCSAFYLCMYGDIDTNQCILMPNQSNICAIDARPKCFMGVLVKTYVPEEL